MYFLLNAVQFLIKTAYKSNTKRETGNSWNAYGKPGKLHAKCAVVDDAVLVSSANLTDDAFNRNIEIGVLIHGSVLAEQLKRHFEMLIEAGVLKQLVEG